MSEINPDFSFPSTHSVNKNAQSMSSQFAPAPQTLHIGSAPSAGSGFAHFGSLDGRSQSRCSPVASRPKKHAHRRSAAMSEDLSAVESSTLLTPQIPSGNKFPNSPKSTHTTYEQSPRDSTSAFMNSPHTPSMRASFFQPLPVGIPVPGSISFDDSPKPESLHRISVVNSPSPRRPFGEPGDLVPPSSGCTSSDESSPGNARRGESTFHKSSGDGSPTALDEIAKKEKRRKRFSYTNVFRKSMDFDANKGGSPPDSPVGDADATIVPSRNSQPISSGHQPAAMFAPSSTVTGRDSPISTPRNSGEHIRETMPAKPTIDLDEALSCSFDHRNKSDGGILDSPFSKTSSGMDAVLEEDGENDDGDSESASLCSIPIRRPASILQKTNSVCSSSSSSSVLRNSPASPRYYASDNSSQQKQKHLGPQHEALPRESLQRDSAVIPRDQTRTISYVGPIPLQPPQPKSPRNFYHSTVTPPRSASPSRSPRYSFEQASNRVATNPQQQAQSTISSGSSSRADNFKPPHKESTPSSPSASNTKKGHARRRSLIDKLMRRS